MSSSDEFVNLTYKRNGTSNLTSAPIPKRSERLTFLNLPNEVLHAIFRQLLKEAQDKSSRFSNYGIQTRHIKNALNMLSISKDVRARFLPEFYRETIIPITLDLEESDYLGYPEIYESEGGWIDIVEAADFNFETIPVHNEHEQYPGLIESNRQRLDKFLVHHGSQIRRIKLNISSIGDYAGPVLSEDADLYRLFKARIQKVIEQLLGNGEVGTPRRRKILELRLCVQPDREYPQEDEDEDYNNYTFECACFNILMSLLEPLREHLDSKQCAKLDWNGVYVLKATDINCGIFSYESISFVRDMITDLTSEEQNLRCQWAKEQLSRNVEVDKDLVSLPVERNEDQWVNFWRNHRDVNPYRLACINFLYPKGIAQAHKTHPVESEWVLKILESSSLMWDIHEIRLVLDLLRERKRNYVIESVYIGDIEKIDPIIMTSQTPSHVPVEDKDSTTIDESTENHHSTLLSDDFQNANHSPNTGSSSAPRLPPPPPPPPSFPKPFTPAKLPPVPSPPPIGPPNTLLIELLTYNGYPYKDHWAYFIRSPSHTSIGVRLHATGDVRNGFRFEIQHEYNLYTTEDIPTKRIPLQWADGGRVPDAGGCGVDVSVSVNVDMYRRTVCAFEKSVRKAEVPGKTLNSVVDEVCEIFSYSILFKYQRLFIFYPLSPPQQITPNPHHTFTTLTYPSPKTHLGKKIIQKDCQSWLVEAADHLVQDGIFEPEIAEFLYAARQ
ncbi:uncharacterized protein Bfra_006091 [Botrytis fragariae]|uniref:Uncharacterized protein n=1 Tax=Botrytis fragariae TaxID=1964551 RepID=A0A8H6ASF6_9HELO|nr:uncharacterized protein Bfra_006091 [Botrytis fragariae]KAF5872728.1 hypothetical protein Bfra_006091 [Botrytis fragariae]